MAGREEMLTRPDRSGRKDEGKKESQNDDRQMAGRGALARLGMVVCLGPEVFTLEFAITSAEAQQRFWPVVAKR